MTLNEEEFEYLVLPCEINSTLQHVKQKACACSSLLGFAARLLNARARRQLQAKVLRALASGQRALALHPSFSRLNMLYSSAAVVYKPGGRMQGQVAVGQHTEVDWLVSDLHTQHSDIDTLGQPEPVACAISLSTLGDGSNRLSRSMLNTGTRK